MLALGICGALLAVAGIVLGILDLTNQLAYNPVLQGFEAASIIIGVIMTGLGFSLEGCS